MTPTIRGGPVPTIPPATSPPGTNPPPPPPAGGGDGAGNRGGEPPPAPTSRFATGLSSVTQRVRGSDPTYGMPSISSRAGTWASRQRPPSPSATVQTVSGGGSRGGWRTPGPAARPAPT